LLEPKAETGHSGPFPLIQAIVLPDRISLKNILPVFILQGYCHNDENAHLRNRSEPKCLNDGNQVGKAG